MSGLFNTSHNLSLYGIPAAWLIAHIPHVYAATATKSYDNRFPRDFPKSLEANQSIDQAVSPPYLPLDTWIKKLTPTQKKNRIRRAHAAAANGHENLGLFASAVVAGNVAGISPSTLNALTGGYLISRVVYTFIYINNETQGAATTRSLAFIVGIGHIFTLFIKSGNLLKDKAASFL
ncbi:hypothetical protein DSL72_003249 [Monilinia vaccinii-corymbosi]|uniref:MAPEG family protein n=1 Tax=Monilinia vaccinii-corymbosi TaxID=61207 RepID=A0A8A3P8U4_9HELO|nr:hypothetical protein DSL72_003249 [Monilinia vaccinii-corymbosi]